MYRHVISSLTPITALVALNVLVGCGNDVTGTAVSAKGDYFALRLNEHAINMSLVAPSKTIQLTATGLDTHGKPFPATGQVTFRATDTSVTVSPSGLVTAHYVTNPSGVRVIATLQQDNITNVDSAVIRVTATPPAAALATFSIQPTLGDSAVRGLYNSYAPTVHAKDVDGQVMRFDVPGGINFVYWRESSDEVKAQCFYCNDALFSGSFTLLDTGHVTFYATSWMYGVSVRDSVKIFVTWAAYVGVSLIYEKLSLVANQNKYVQVGGTVSWFKVYEDSTGIIFDDSTAVDSAMLYGTSGPYTGSGNLYFPAQEYVQLARRFPKAGTYKWHSQSDPTVTGKVYVMKPFQ